MNLVGTSGLYRDSAGKEYAAIVVSHLSGLMFADIVVWFRGEWIGMSNIMITDRDYGAPDTWSPQPPELTGGNL